MAFQRSADVRFSSVRAWSTLLTLGSREGVLERSTSRVSQLHSSACKMKLLILLYLASTALALPTSGPIVASPASTWDGKTASGIDSFLGMPFAQPPVASLRFAPPLASIRTYPDFDATIRSSVPLRRPS